MLSPSFRLLCLVLVLVIAAFLPASGANIAAGSITVRSVPGGATVTLDGVSQGLTPVGNDALVISVEPGAHQLVLSKSGYLDDHHPFWIGSGQRSDIRITLAATTSESGSVSIVSSPAGADLSIDGGYRGRTPITVSGLPAGRHAVLLDLPGYVRDEETVEIQNGVMTYLEPALTATSSVGFISVVSIPSGASVFVDGTYRGPTPLTVAATAGSRRVELDRAGYADWTTTAQVTGGATIQVNAYLQVLQASSSGGIAVSSDPVGASVYLDGEYRGVTTGNSDLELIGVPAGSHALSLRLDGYEEYRLTVQVTPDSTVKVRPQLTPAGNASVTPTPTAVRDLGTLQANSTPSGARVSLDGSYKGTTPLLITDVPAGSHTVRFSLTGYVEREQQVDVQAGQTTTVAANLTPANQTQSGVPAFVALGALCIVAGSAIAVTRRRR